MASRKMPWASKIVPARRVIIDLIEPMPREPRARMAQHQASKEHRGPCPGSSIREHLRSRVGYESAAKMIRAMYDLAEKPKRRQRGKKGNPRRPTA